MGQGMVSYDTLVVGGGFYGCCLALHWRRAHGQRVALVEREADLLQRASYNNQARVHNGYHYPRSLLTGLRSRINFPRFVEDYRYSIDDHFEKYYAVASIASKVTAAQFEAFCKRIGAPVEPAPPRVKELFNRDHIEEVFLVREYAFDAVKLCERLRSELEEANIEVHLETEAELVRRLEDARLELTCQQGDETLRLSADRVFNCTYSRTNTLLAKSGLPTIPLKHELTEIALVDVPEPLREIGLTVMCGPFFSVMPFPPRNLHSFSHVRYTPHGEWHDLEAGPHRDPYVYFDSLSKQSSYPHMAKDAERYLPLAREFRYVDSLWEVKTVLPKSEIDDSRPILFRTDQGLPGLTCIMGAKIDNVYDVIEFGTAGQW
jgi:glycine/D-amino acid oxidase-like deaminating enzyme